MSLPLNTINFSTPFLIGVPNSRVSPEWIRMLANLITTVAAPGSSTNTSIDLETLVYTTRTPLHNAAELDELRSLQLLYANLRGAARDLARQFADLSAQIERRQPLQGQAIPDDLVISARQRTASASMQTGVFDDTASNLAMYPTFSSGFTGAQTMKTSSSKWTYNPSTGRVTSTQLVATAGFGCNGKTPQTAFSLGAASTDLASVIALANNLRTMSINNGIGA